MNNVGISNNNNTRNIKIREWEKESTHLLSLFVFNVRCSKVKSMHYSWELFYAILYMEVWMEPEHEFIFAIECENEYFPSFNQALAFE